MKIIKFLKIASLSTIASLSMSVVTAYEPSLSDFDFMQVAEAFALDDQEQLMLLEAINQWDDFTGNFDCNACNYEPKFYQVDKIAKRAECWTIAGTFGAAMDVVLGMCDNYGGRMDASEQIDAAKQLLINAKVWNQHDFDGVRIRLCPIRPVTILGLTFNGADGMVPKGKHILIDVHQKNADVSDLASLIAHEMKHVQQYEDWGNGKFRCKYADELLAGYGFGRHNEVEKEAYEFQDKADKIIKAHKMGVSDKGYENSLRQFVDINGDGKIDYCREVGNHPNTFIACATINSNGILEEYGYEIRDKGYENSIRQFKDVNGDGKVDYCREVGNHPNTFIACATINSNGILEEYGLRLSDGECQMHGW